MSSLKRKIESIAPESCKRAEEAREQEPPEYPEPVCMDGLGKPCAIWLEKRLGGVDTAAMIQSCLQQLLLPKVISRLDELNVHAQCDPGTQQVMRDLAAETVGYMRVYMQDYSLLRRGLKVLRKMRQKAVVAKCSADVCFAILEHLESVLPPQVHSEIVLCRYIRRLIFDNLDYLRFTVKQNKEWMQLSERLLCFLNSSSFGDNGRALGAQKQLLKTLAAYGTKHAKSTSMINMTKSLLEKRDSLQKSGSGLFSSLSNMQSNLHTLDIRMQQVKSNWQVVVNRIGEIRNEFGNDISDDEFARLYPSYHEFLDEQNNLNREIRKIDEQMREWKQFVELYIKPAYIKRND
jgi:hypothetical protein